MKTYKWLRGILKASAFATVMFVMQACYGAPQPLDESFLEEEKEMVNDTVQQAELEQETPVELEAE